jgi:hypothetical protein
MGSSSDSIYAGLQPDHSFEARTPALPKFHQTTLSATPSNEVFLQFPQGWMNPTPTWTLGTSDLDLTDLEALIGTTPGSSSQDPTSLTDTSYESSNTSNGPSPSSSSIHEHIINAQAPRRRHQCPYQPCTRSFNSRIDLERHTATKQHEKDVPNMGLCRYRCQYAWCERSQKGWWRKDHYLRHVEKIHGGIMADG